MVQPVGLAIVEEGCDSRGVQADGEWFGLSVDQQTFIGSRTGDANHIIWKTTIIGDIHLIERADVGHEPSPGMGSRISKQFPRVTARLFPTSAARQADDMGRDDHADRKKSEAAGEHREKRRGEKVTYWKGVGE